MLANATRLTGHLDALERAPVPALAFLIAAGFAIGQPILADQIGILGWDQCFCGGAEADWNLGLTAVLWYTATAVPAGLLLARRAAARSLRARPSEFVSGIVPAALGTLLATPVVAALARSAVVPGVDHPGLVAALGVPVGALIGVVAAFAALASAPVARGLAASWLWVWFVGLVAGMLLELAESGGAQPLGGIDVAFADGTVAAGLYRVLADAGWLVAVLAPVAVAGFVAYRSVRRGSGVAAATLGGAAGTLLILVTYRTQGAASGDWAGIALIELLLSAAVAALAALATRYRIGANPGRLAPPRARPPARRR